MAAYPLKRKGWCTLSYIKLYGFSFCRGFLIARLHTKVLWTKLNGEYALCGLLILIPEQADRLRDSSFLELNSGFQCPGFRVPQAKNPPFQNRNNLSWCETILKYSYDTV